MSAWKDELDAILGARHGGAGEVLLRRLRDLDTRHPNVPEIQNQIAWTCDTLGRDEEALVAYDKAIALGLAPNEHAGALLGISACLLRLKQVERACTLLETARPQFPEQREFEAYLALALHAAGRHAESLQILLVLLAETSDDPGIAAHQRTLRHLATTLSHS